ncbi:hypothetical protein ACH5RR_000203 [Cinchona calisaya]|uniref:Uncharacterized protein n=1 Tax=Cinchona calisaya TaxID=153742 RepID=A0ABD3AZZ6_9GENT
MDKNAMCRKCYAEMPESKKKELLLHRRESYPEKKIKDRSRDAYHPIVDQARTYKRKRQAYVSKTMLGHVEIGVMHPESDRLCSQNEASPFNTLLDTVLDNSENYLASSCTRDRFNEQQHPSFSSSVAMPPLCTEGNVSASLNPAYVGETRPPDSAFNVMSSGWSGLSISRTTRHISLVSTPLDTVIVDEARPPDSDFNFEDSSWSRSSTCRPTRLISLGNKELVAEMHDHENKIPAPFDYPKLTELAKFVNVEKNSIDVLALAVHALPVYLVHKDSEESFVQKFVIVDPPVQEAR